MADLSDSDQDGADGFAHSAEHRHQHSAQGREAGARPVRRIEVITGPDRRRRWSRELKAQITEESFRPGTNVSELARRHGMSLGLLHYWRRSARAQAASGEKMQFVPVLTADPGEAADVRGAIEIEVAGVRIRVKGAVDGTTLRTVMAAVRSTR